MKRIFLTAVASSALVFGAVGVAAAHNGAHQSGEAHHHAQHAGAHKRHHRRAHLVRFGSAAASGTTTPGTMTPTTAPASSSDETAGTVASFANGVLTVKLTDGSLVSGKVNERTEIECRSAMPTAVAADDHGETRGGDGSDDRGQDDNSGLGEERHGNDGQDDDANDEAEHCTSAALVSGAVVREAELSVGSAGSVWEKVELGQ